MEFLSWSKIKENREHGPLQKLRELAELFHTLLDQQDTEKQDKEASIGDVDVGYGGFSSSASSSSSSSSSGYIPERTSTTRGAGRAADLVPVVQALRNCCSVQRNCEYLHSQTRTYSTISKIFRRVALMSYQLDEDPGLPLVGLLLQVLANTAAAGHAGVNEALFWSDPAFSRMRDMLAAACRQGSRRALGAAIAALYNALVSDSSSPGSSDARRAVSRRLQRLASCRALWCQLLLALCQDGFGAAAAAATAGGVSSAGAGAGAGATAEEEDEAMGWAHILACRLLQQEEQAAGGGVLLQLFRLVGPRDTPDSLWSDDDPAPASASASASASVAAVAGQCEPWSVLHEQVILLQLLREALEDASYFRGRQQELEQEQEQEQEQSCKPGKAAAATSLLSSASYVSYLLHLTRCVCTLSLERFQALESIAEKTVWLAAVPVAISIIGTSLALNVGDEGAPHVQRISHLLSSETDVLRFVLQCVSSIPVLDGVADTHLEQVSGMNSIFSDPLAAQVSSLHPLS